MAITWQDWENAVAAGHIVYLYKIQFKGKTLTTNIPYATGREEKTWESVTFRPHPCVHEEIKFDEIGAKTAIRVPAAKLWIETCLKHNPKVTLELFRWREELGGAQSLFFGNLIETLFVDSDIKLSFGTPLNMANAQLVTYYTQRYCNHDMYGKYCGLQFSTLKQDFGSYSIDGRRRISLGTSLDTEYWKNALVFYVIQVTDGVYTFHLEQSNMVKTVDGSSVVTKYPVSSYIDTSFPITLAPNCLLDLDRCNNIFGNLPRACAWPDMPRTNYAVTDVTKIGEGNPGDIGGPR